MDADLETLTDDAVAQWKTLIDAMTHAEMASLWRFAPSGHPVFRSDGPLYQHFAARFQSFGGMTADVSKKIGW